MVGLVSNQGSRTVRRCPWRLVPAGRSRGFTLLETALATVIIGVGVLAMIEAQASFTRTNDFSSNSATGNYLANELRERMHRLPRHDPVSGLYTIVAGGSSTVRGWGAEAGENGILDYDDLDDFDGAVFGAGGAFAGPVDATGTVLQEISDSGAPVLDEQEQSVPLRGWSQRVSVEKVDPQNVATVRDGSYSRAAIGTTFAGLTVGQFPLRVTITVRFQGPLDTEPHEMAKLVFIAPFSPTN